MDSYKKMTGTIYQEMNKSVRNMSSQYNQILITASHIFLPIIRAKRSKKDLYVLLNKNTDFSPLLLINRLPDIYLLSDGVLKGDLSVVHFYDECGFCLVELYFGPGVQAHVKQFMGPVVVVGIQECYPGGAADLHSGHGDDRTFY